MISGVPQGFHLPPLLYNLFVNEIKFSNSYIMLLFADVFRIIKISDDFEMLQNNLTHLVVCCGHNNLQLNFSKCRVMTFSKKTIPIPS